MTGTVVTTILAALALAAVHAFVGAVPQLRRRPRTPLLSVAGGISIAYVFVHLLPEIAEAQRAVEEEASGLLPAIETHAYVMALVGLAAFYGVESRAREERRADEGEPTAVTFWLHMVTFGTYNVLIGEVLEAQARRGLQQAALYTLALGVHYVVNDRGLREHHPSRYHDLGRWLLAGLTVAGAVLGLLVDLREPVQGLLIALVAGGIVLNTVKEELPDASSSRFWAFCLGAGAYTALLLAT